MVWPKRDGTGWRARVSVSGANPRLRSCTAADKFVSSDPDQSHYQPGSAAVALHDLTPVSVHHTLMLLCLMAWTAVCVCVVSPAWIPQEENMSSAISSIKLCLHALCLFILTSNWVFSQSTSTGAQNLLFPQFFRSFLHTPTHTPTHAHIDTHTPTLI